MFVTFFTLRIIYPWQTVDTEKIRGELKEEVEEIGPISTNEKKSALIVVTGENHGPDERSEAWKVGRVTAGTEKANPSGIF
ncbi:hypothetical protein AKJ65_03330 [candidate division MSBL1 archaeon SCGC-AAA259E19]|uniref:Uncharacterized protein n=1 Tax=candidate division MSBL1 archaeon SCGC-AAA259E19 TaxID=1698264 RepID=A0A133UKR5_9EURY|nr:hypothetical protein AKJ65_03330 [candidate division MSBL1 archaeon SCGC-AAA259E19]